MIIKDESFRKLYHKYIVIRADEFARQVGQGIQLDIAREKNPDMSTEELFKSIMIDESVNAILAIPYVDHEAGVSFMTIAIGTLDSENINIIKRESFASLSIFRRNDVRDMEFEYLENLNTNSDFDIGYYEEFSQMVYHYSQNEAIEALRSIEEIDHLRNEDWSDDVLVHFIKDGLKAEGMWVRYEDINEEGLIAGKLLNTPYQDFGVKAGDDVEAFLTKNGEDIILVCELNG